MWQRNLKDFLFTRSFTNAIVIFDQIEANNVVINESWDTEGKSADLADNVGLMVYEGTQSLTLVKNFVNGTDQAEGDNYA